MAVQLTRPEQLGSLVERLGGAVDSAVTACILRRVVAASEAAQEGDLLLVAAPRYIRMAQRSPAIVLCSEELAPRLEAGRRWRHPYAAWVLAQLLADSHEPVPAPAVANAQVDPAAEVSPDAIIRAGAVVQAGVVVGPGCIVGENAVLYAGVRLGQRVTIGPLSVIGRPGFGWVTGPQGELCRVPHRGGVIIEDDAEVGALCTVDAGMLVPTRVCRGAKLDAHVHVGHNVQVGPQTLVAAQVGFAGSSSTGLGVHIGGQAGITDHAHVGDGARVAAKSGVIGDIPEAAVVAGFPAVPRMRWLRAMAELMRRPGK